ncbi:hypothetical protein GCM10025857_21150 [Alicyclobacillus contaminans]|uniref:hypothetical protein n=1 Tax=Alicyclobacillus contaminans TaxID=392016 RepID=UPI0004249591|nr:hypothetical protein [Alicyclobacillus contaminans]GMA50758.1 hypothetical protein GCM10025857_21150 [Alicyclobacillus contaminans]
MLDILLLAETSWMMLWITHRGVHRALIFTGGIVSAGYVASNLSSWLTEHLVPANAAALAWLAVHISTSAETVNALSTFLPPVPAATGMNSSQWIAFQLIRAVFHTAITVAIFLAFAVASYVSDALWDVSRVLPSKRERWLSGLLGTLCGIYVAYLTCGLLVHLAWLNGVSLLVTSIEHSVCVGLLARAVGLH